MYRPYTVALLLLACICQLISLPVFSQCVQPPPLDDCNGTEPTLTDNETLGTGAKKWYYGAAAVYNQVTIRGGTLVVCGDLTFTNFYLDSGTIVIRPGARLRIGGGAGIVLRGNTSIYNYGTFDVTSNLVLDNSWASATKPNVLINATTTSVFSMSHQYFVINNPYSFFVNNGRADFHGIITDPAAASGSVCLGNTGQTTMRVLYNKSRKPYVAPTGTACVQVSQFSQFLDTLTASPNINVCLGPSHTSDASCGGCRPNAWGPANIFNSCNSCGDIQVLSIRRTPPPAAPDKDPVELKLAPNPFVQQLTLTWPRGKKPIEVIITNTSGGIVHRQRISSSLNACSIALPAALPWGEYVAKLIFNQNIIVRKIIKAPR
jgi:hypothetical protein